MLTKTQSRVRALFKRLRKAPRIKFPKPGRGVTAPERTGVYIIYSPGNKVLHVGASVRGRRGLRQRLNQHLQGRSSFVSRYLKKQGYQLRRGYSFRCLPVRNHRDRALLEMYAMGYLCPKHIGLGQLRVAKKV